MESWGVAYRPLTDYILVTIRITIRIREELPQFYYAGFRRRSVLCEYF